ncbi:MAG: rpsP [Frankiales bacterium]|nr:rpsP [Frankiales bacterium]
MATKIKLMRLGKMRAPYYRIVVADARTKRDGRSIETIGKYHPKEHPSFIEVDGDRAAYWLSVGAQPTEAVTAILKVTGDWQKFKGLPAPPPMLVAEPKTDKKAVFEAAAREGIEGAAAGAATTPKKKAAPKKAAADAAEADAPAAEAAPEAPVAEAPVAEVAAEAPAAEADAPAADAPVADSSAADAAVEAPAADAVAEPDATPAGE